MKFDISRNARREFPESKRLLALIPAGLFFVALLPFLLIVLGRTFDRWLGLPAFDFPPYDLILGVLLIAVGWPLAIWTIIVQFTAGRGTPIPAMAPQQLLVQPPYTLCRNPMTLGAILAYLGVGFLIGSISALLLVILLGARLLWYIHRNEEPQLLEQFGQDYADYRRRTPFLFPRIKF